MFLVLYSKLKSTIIGNEVKPQHSVADPDLELRKGGGGAFLLLSATGIEIYDLRRPKHFPAKVNCILLVSK